MAITIPDAVLGATFTNDITGVTYTYDGQKWIADSGSAGGSIGEHEHDEKYVNVSGDTMTGDLRIEPTTGSQPLVVKANPEASSGANVIDVFSNEGNRIFWVDSNRAGTSVHAGRPTNSYDLTDKKYVDDRCQDIFTYSFSGFNHGDPSTIEQADLLKGQFYVHGDPSQSTFAYFHEQALEGKLLSLPCHGSNDHHIAMTIFEHGKTYTLDKNNKKVQPDGRRQVSYRYTTQVTRFQPGGTGQTVMPMWTIVTNFVWGSFELNKKYDFQFSYTLM